MLLGNEGAPLTFVTWGSVKGPVREAMERLKEENIDINIIHFAGIWPFPVKEAQDMIAKVRHVVLIENNATAQFGGLLREHTGIDIQDKILKYNGRPFFPEEIIEEARKRLG